MRAFVIPALTAAFACGCVAPSGALPSDARLILGTGQDAFAPLGPDSSVELIRGIQGGFHVLSAAEFFGFDPTDFALRYVATDADGNRISYPAAIVLTPGRFVAQGDHYERTGDRVIFDIDHADEVVGASIVIEVSVIDGDEPLLSDARGVVVVDEMADR